MCWCWLDNMLLSDTALVLSDQVLVLSDMQGPSTRESQSILQVCYHATSHCGLAMVATVTTVATLTTVVLLSWLCCGGYSGLAISLFSYFAFDQAPYSISEVRIMTEPHSRV